mmetsp:Transcript_68440/g.155020  ORF Transcript_68440/g.155020 Transcript_68440/m.155020 type:complete len:293 (-) Transcript_68440:134-1012(-)
MPTYKNGDTLIFTLFDKDFGKFDDHLGRAQLSGSRLSGGNFEGDLILAGDGAAPNSSLKVIVTPVPRPNSKLKKKPKAKAGGNEVVVPAAPKESPSEYKMTLSRKPDATLGMQLDALDGITLVVQSLAETGMVADYNAAAEEEEQVRVGDAILEVNGSGTQTIMVTQLKGAQELSITACRLSCHFVMEINKLEWEMLGMELRYFNEASLSVVVTSVSIGPVMEWNKKNPASEVKAGCRIVAVNGEAGKGKELMDRINATEEILELSIFRPPALSAEGVTVPKEEREGDKVEN